MTPSPAPTPPMTAGREQDARETLRALSEAATPGPWVQPENADGDGLYAGVWSETAGEYVVEADDPLDMEQARADAALIAAAVNYVRAALLPSPPATRGCDACDGTGDIGQAGSPTRCPACNPPATIGAGEARPYCDCGHKIHANPCERHIGAGCAEFMAGRRAPAASPPATDGDAAPPA